MPSANRSPRGRTVEIAGRECCGHVMTRRLKRGPGWREWPATTAPPFSCRCSVMVKGRDILPDLDHIGLANGIRSLSPRWTPGRLAGNRGSGLRRYGVTSSKDPPLDLTPLPLPAMIRCPFFWTTDSSE